MRLKAFVGATALLSAAGALGWTQPAAAQSPEPPVVRTDRPTTTTPTVVPTVPSGLTPTAEQPATGVPTSRPRWPLLYRLFHRSSPQPASAPTSTQEPPLVPGPASTVVPTSGVAPADGRTSSARMALDESSQPSGIAADAAPQPAKLQARVRSACGLRARDVQVQRQADKTLLVTVRLPNTKAQDEAIKKIMELPEMTSPQVRLVVEVKP
jgi:hypothetical protein